MICKAILSAVCAAAVLAPLAANAQEAESDYLKKVRERVSVASDWANLKLDDYGSEEITYDGDPITLRVTNHTMETSTTASLLKKSFTVLEKMSEGKLKINARWGGVVHGVAEGFEANRSGITDMAACFTSINITSFPLTKALTLPGLFPNEAVMAMVAEHLAEKYFRPEFERQGVYILNMTGSSQFNIFSNEPITTLEDLQGTKIRTASGITKTVYEHLGASPVSMSSAEYYTALQRGLLDAVITSDAAAKIFRVNEVTTDHTETPINVLPLEWCMNPRTYNSLPPDLQKVLYDWARQRTQNETQLLFTLGSAQAREQFLKEGMTYHKIDPEEWKRWQAKFDPIVDEYIEEGEKEGLPTRQLVADIRKLVDKYSKMSLNELMLDAIHNPAQGVAPVVQ